MPDQRWARRDIKSVSLLAQVLAKQAAKERGGKEAVMHEDGVVTEAGASSLFMVTKAGAIVTRPNGTKILPGCTRAALEAMAAEHQLHFEERLFTLDEMRAAAEVFVTAASAFVVAGVTLDGVPIGDGRPAPSQGGSGRYTSPRRSGLRSEVRKMPLPRPATTIEA